MPQTISSPPNILLAPITPTHATAPTEAKANAQNNQARMNMRAELFISYKH